MARCQNDAEYLIKLVKCQKLHVPSWDLEIFPKPLLNPFSRLNTWKPKEYFYQTVRKKAERTEFCGETLDFFPKFQKYFRKIKFKQRQARSSFDDHAQSLCSFWPGPGGSIIPTRRGFGSVSLKISFKKFKGLRMKFSDTFQSRPLV